MRIVILDGAKENPGDLSWEGFSELGDLIVYDNTDPEDVADRIAAADAVIVNKVNLNKGNLSGSCNLKYIGVLATGYNIVDVEYAKSRGITVTNIPSYGTDAVAQYAISLLLEVTGRVGHHNDAVKAGRWASSGEWCFWDYPLMELAGKTMGIIGFGRIGQRTGEIAKALGMKIVYNDKIRSAEKESDGYRYMQLNDMLPVCDVIALHCPLLPDTEKIINRTTLEKMKNGVIIINNSRGQLIDEDALAEALSSGKVGAAALDVVATEPIQPDNQLLKFDNCLITPHISWAPKESRERLMKTAVENLRAYIEGAPTNVVN